MGELQVESRQDTQKGHPEGSLFLSDRSGQESLTGVVKGVGFGLRLLSRQARAELLSGLRRGWGVDVMTPPRCGQA